MARPASQAGWGEAVPPLGQLRLGEAGAQQFGEHDEHGSTPVAVHLSTPDQEPYTACLNQMRAFDPLGTVQVPS